MRGPHSVTYLLFRCQSTCGLKLFRRGLAVLPALFSTPHLNYSAEFWGIVPGNNEKHLQLPRYRVLTLWHVVLAKSLKIKTRDYDAK